MNRNKQNIKEDQIINKELVENIAKLSKLQLSNEEIINYQKELARILEYIEKLKEIDVSKVETFCFLDNLKNVKRPDFSDKENQNIKEKLIQLMPAVKNRYLKVKKVI